MSGSFSRFLGRPVPKFIHIAMARQSGAPMSSRAYAALLGEGQIWVFVSRSEWGRLQATLQDRSMLAALLTSGTDNESYQIKGTFGGCRSMQLEDISVLEQEREWIRDTFPDLLALVAVNPAECIAVAIQNFAVYNQTPGPLAGSLISERSL